MIRDVVFSRQVFSPDGFPADGLPEVCISGRSNVGKSSLINCLGNRKDLARTSQQPGKTRSLNYYSAGGRYYLVDLPGYGFAKAPKTEKDLFARLVNPYLETRKELRGVVQLIDSRHGPVAGDLQMLEWLRHYRGKVLYVFTKIDKLGSSGRGELAGKCAKEFGAENSVLFSARTGVGLDRIVSWIKSAAAVLI